jgi:surface carbohydrate biosynthesis protein
MKHRLLYLPIETKARELHGKTLLACKAVERGWDVIMGGQRDIARSMLDYPPGMFVEISITKRKANYLAAYRAHGHRTADLCEESIVYTDGRDYVHRKVDPLSLNSMDVLLVSGGRNERHLLEYRPESAGKIAVTGNPRFDTLMPGVRSIFAAEASRIKERFGRFLLVNTNFGRVNQFKSGNDVLAGLDRRGMIADEAHGDFMRRLIDYKRDQLRLLKHLLIGVKTSNLFDAVVVRPHPGENHDMWRQWAEPLGIGVHYEGSANCWMLAADAILHTGCTTGIEGLLLDRPVTSFVPVPGSEMLNSADEVSVQVASAAELITYVEACRTWPEADVRARLQAQRGKLGYVIANVEEPLSVDRILDAFDKLDVAQSPRGFGGARSGVTSFRDRLRDRIGRHFSSRRLQKYPGVVREEISGPIAAWANAGVLRQIPQFTQMDNGIWLFS